jgi:hypothetical protein
MGDEPRVLCYPNFNPNDLDGVKHSLLLYDRVSVIAPTMTPRYRVPMTPAGHAQREGTEIKTWGALDGLREDCRLDDGSSAVEFIDDKKIATARPEEFKSALSQDLADPEVAAWAARLQGAHPDREYFWYISGPYFHDYLKIDIGDPAVRARFCLERVDDARLGELVKVPFLVGMSLGLSEALWAAVDRGRSLFTLDPTSADFLLLRLRRGWRMLGNDPALQRNLDLRLAKDFAASQLSTWTLGVAAPELFDRVPGMTLKEVMGLRRQSDDTDALTEFRGGMARIVSERELWRAKDFQTFRVEAERVADAVLKPAYEALDRKPFGIKDVVTSLDFATAAESFVKDIPKLFISGTAAATVGGTVALAGGVAFVPAALFGLACGLTGSAVAQVIGDLRERLKERHDAQFLTYSVKLHEALAPR